MSRPPKIRTAMAEAIHSVSPLITRTNSPSVKMISGQDINFSSGLTMAFTRPKITAIAANTVQASRSTRIPGTSHAATTSATLVMNQWIRIRMFC